uniref:WPP domain-associated protein-like isoform X1 n=2 Tax=Nicotiana sylvestris TaxID=4096 RepID=A0A1U7VIS0_NICSY|nr:PREDICTED: WPP domain-associated protein-like isoform X1 [Nicotiana sylvestris]
MHETRVGLQIRSWYVYLMGITEVLENGGAGNGNGINSCGGNAYVGTSNSGPERMVNGGSGSENLGDEILEDFDLYWEDINDRMMVSRMVSNSVVKGIVRAVEQEADERMISKEMELAKLKEYLQFHDVGLSKTESLGSPVLGDELEGLNSQKHWTSSDVFLEHEKLREILDGLRNSTKDQFKKLKKGIDRVRGFSSFRRSGSCSELVGLGGILREKESESWVHVDKTLKNLKMTMEAIFIRMDEMIQLSKTSMGQWQEEHLIESELDAVVMQSLIRGMQEGFEDKLWDQYHQSRDIRIEKLNEISSLRNGIEIILKSLSSTETGRLTLHGSQDVDHFHRKMSSEHVASSKSIWEEKGWLEDSKSDIPEKFEAASLKHMSREEMVDYFNNMMTKMKREHESILEKKTDDYFALRREYLNLIGRGSIVPHKTDQGEFDFLRKKIPEVILKLDDILVKNKNCPEFTQKAESLDNLKDRIDSLLSENRQLNELLRDKENDVKCMLSEISSAAEKSRQQSFAEVNMLKQIDDINLVVEDLQIAASVREEVYTCFLRDLIRKKGREADESSMEFHIMNGIYDIILREAYINAESTSKFELEDSELECLIVQDLYGVIFSEGIKDAQDKLKELYQDYLNENEGRIFLEMKAIQREYELTLEVEEKEKLKQMIYQLETSVDEKDKLARDASTALAKEKEHFQLVTQELNAVREHASRQQRLVSENNIELDAVKSQLAEALEQIEVLKEVTHQLNQKLVEKVQELKEADDKTKVVLAVSEERQNILALNETKEIEQRKQMETVICTVHELSKMLADFEYRVNGSLETNHARLEHSSCQLNSLAKKTNSLRRTVLLYRQRLEKRCSDLQKAEAEVDLLGDEVDTLLRLLEKIYIALDHYSPVLQHYPGVSQIFCSKKS